MAPRSSSSEPPRAGPPRRSEPLFSTIFRLSRLWGFIAFLVFVVVLFREVVTPFIFAFALAYVLGPVIRRLEPRLGRVVSVIIVYLIMLGILAAFFVVFLPLLIQDFTRLRDSLPQILEYVDQQLLPQATAWIESSFGGLADAKDVTDAAGPGTGAAAEGVMSELIATPRPDGAWSINLEGAQLRVEEVGRGRWVIEAPRAASEDTSLTDSLRKVVSTKGDEYSGMIYQALRVLIGGVSAFLTKFVITLMLAAFILIDPGRISKFVRSLIPGRYRSNVAELSREMDIGLSGVIRGQLLICLVNGVLTYIGLVLLGIKYSFLLGLIAGAFSLIPIFGTIISSIPIMVVALVSGEDGGISIAAPLLVLAWICGIHLLEANVLNPKIIGDAAKMHPIIVIFALLAGEQVYGLTGALLAVPVASIVQTFYLYVLRRTTALRRDGRPGPSETMVGTAAITAELSGMIQQSPGELSQLSPVGAQGQGTSPLEASTEALPKADVTPDPE